MTEVIDAVQLVDYSLIEAAMQSFTVIEQQSEINPQG